MYIYMDTYRYPHTDVHIHVQISSTDTCPYIDVQRDVNIGVHIKMYI